MWQRRKGLFSRHVDVPEPTYPRGDPASSRRLYKSPDKSGSPPTTSRFYLQSVSFNPNWFLSGIDPARFPLRLGGVTPEHRTQDALPVTRFKHMAPAAAPWASVSRGRGGWRYRVTALVITTIKFKSLVESLLIPPTHLSFPTMHHCPGVACMRHSMAPPLPLWWGV